jgi:hypothetical protein
MAQNYPPLPRLALVTAERKARDAEDECSPGPPVFTEIPDGRC